MKRCLLYLLPVVLLLYLPTTASVQNKDRLSEQIKAKQQAIAALEKQIEAGEKEIARLRKNKNSAQNTVQRLARQIASRRQLLDETEHQIALLGRQLARTDSTASALDRDLQRYRTEYAEMVREAYRNYRQNNYLTYLFSARDFDQVARRIANIRGVADLRERKMQEIARTATEVTHQQSLLNEQKEKLDGTRRQLDAQKNRYEKDQADARAQLKKMSAREKSALRKQESQQQQLDAEIAALRRLTKGNTAGASFSSKTSNLRLPVEGGRVKKYSDNIAEITGAKGAAVISIYEGKVVDIKRNRITNRYDVYIAHGEYITSYANLNSVSVNKGATVARNARIGTIGTAVNLETMSTEYKLVFGIYPPQGAKKMRAADCFRK